jgi:hypothetical protein
MATIIENSAAEAASETRTVWILLRLTDKGAKIDWVGDPAFAIHNGQCIHCDPAVPPMSCPGMAQHAEDFGELVSLVSGFPMEIRSVEVPDGELDVLRVASLIRRAVATELSIG